MKVNEIEINQEGAEDIMWHLMSYNLNIKDEIRELGLDFKVADEIKVLDPSCFRNNRIYAEFMTDTPDAVAKLVSSRNEDYTPDSSLMILIPALRNGPLVIDSTESNLGTYAFYMFDKGIAFPVLSISDRKYGPVLIDKLYSRFAINADEYGGLDKVILNDFGFKKLAGNKWKTKEVLKQAGLDVPIGYKFGCGDFRRVKKAILEFKQQNGIEDFVIKRAYGECGSFVKLFGSNEIEGGENYVLDLVKYGGDIFIEERIKPEGDLDRNVRALVTLEKEPKWIGGFIRYGEMGYDHINIFRGAGRAKLEDMDLGVSLDCIKERAIQIVKTSYEANNCSGFRGYCGVDLIIGKSCRDIENKIYCPEINYHGGGVSSMIKNNGEPLFEIGSVLMNSFNKSLGIKREIDFSDGKIIRSLDLDICLFDLYFNYGKFEEVILLGDKLKRKAFGNPGFHLSYGLAFCYTGEYERARGVLESFIDNTLDAKSPYLDTAKEALERVNCFLGDRKECNFY